MQRHKDRFLSEKHDVLIVITLLNIEKAFSLTTNQINFLRHFQITNLWIKINLMKA